MFTFRPAAMQHFHPRKILQSILLLPVALPGFSARGEDFSARYAALGELIVTQLQSAPFPHPRHADKGNFHVLGYAGMTTRITSITFTA